MKTISIDIKVPLGDSCLVDTELAQGRCWFYKGRACLAFNKVIVEARKGSACLTKCGL